MSLRKKKSTKEKIPSTYPYDHPLFAEATERYCSSTLSVNASEKAKDKAAQSAVNDKSGLSGNTREIILKLDDRESIKKLRIEDRKSISRSKPNYFLTLSMSPCFDNNWNKYNREFQVIKLHKRAAILLYKLFVKLNPILKDTDYRNWPFFFGTIEHFDPEGKLVAPHMHILFRHDADIETLTKIIAELWAQAVEDSGKTGIDLQIVEPKDLNKRASYILKYSHQDGLAELRNGVIPHKLCENYGWTLDAIAHDKWRLNRDTLHQAKNTKHPILKEGNPYRRREAALRKIFPDLPENELEKKRAYLRERGLLRSVAINNSVTELTHTESDLL